ncbi:MAG: hypothetical protein ACRD0Y_02555 [Terriglobales bacterium]
MAGKLKRNLAIGLLGGLAGTAAMDVYWRGLAKAKPELMKSDEEPTTQKAVRKVLKQAGVRSPSRQVRKRGGQAVHWGTGLTWGLIAGAGRAAGVPATWGMGLPFGAAVWAATDEWGRYMVDLGKHPKDRPMRDHATSLGAHLAYGLGVWAVVKVLGGSARRKRGFLSRAA